MILRISNKFVIEPFERKIRLKGSSVDIKILPEGKTIFLLKESVECSLTSFKFGESAMYNLRIITNGLTTTNIVKGIGAQFSLRHVGKNIVRCSLSRNESIFTKRVITRK